MGKLSQEQFKFFGQALEHNMARAKKGDGDVFAQRLFVLRHLTAPGETLVHPENPYGGEGHDLMKGNEYVLPHVRYLILTNTRWSQSSLLFPQALCLSSKFTVSVHRSGFTALLFR